MSTTAFRANEFYPPAPAPMRRAMFKALLVHALLILALTWGVSWQRQAQTVAFEAELWSAVPQAAAPQAASPEPTPQPQPAPAVVKETSPPPVAKADIQTTVKPAPTPPPTPNDKQLDKQREDRMKQLLAMAGKTDAPGNGQAAQASSPSANYAARIRGRVIPNITFPERDTTPGNPETVAQFRIAPDGTIILTSLRVVKSSGLPAWDKAVVNALEKTAQIPRDVDGRFPATFFELSFKVRE